MARIRSIKPEFWTDEKIVELSAFARLLFIGLWNFADDEGRMIYSPKRIKMQIFPADSIDISELFGEIRREKLVTVYVIDGIEYLQISNFTEHQKIDKRSASKLPAPGISAESPRIPTTDQGRDQGVDQGSKPPLPPKGGKSPAIEFKTFLADCKAKGEKAVSDYKPVFDFAEQVGLPTEFVQLAWFEFGRVHGEGGAKQTKRQKDWRKTFRNYVEGNYLKLWWLKPEGGYELTTLGRQAEKANAERLAA